MHAKTVDRQAGSSLAGRALNLLDFERRAGKVLPPALHHYVASYSEDGESHRRNLRSFRMRAFVPRVMVDVSQRSAATSLMGAHYPYPFGIAPMGFCRLVAADGDVVLARAAAKAGLPCILSGASLTPMEAVRTAGPTSWFQAYIPGEDDRIGALVDRVEAAGFDTLVITADTAVFGQHEVAARHGFRSPVTFGPAMAWQGLSHPRWLWQVLGRDGFAGTRLRFENADATPGPPVFSSTLVRDIGRRDALSWRHFEQVRRRWSGKLVVKGIMAPADAAIAQASGADGIIVSSHGGRQIDCAVSGLDALEAIAAKGLSLALMYDGGIRRGSDVLKAVRLGADFVFVGRPMLQAAAVAGEDGVAHALTLLAHEVSTTMGLLGVNTLAELKEISLERDQERPA
ncbi:alpha-hydroxy acid oxidase [Bosea sp. 124]|uniref:alpha-hydroxy acid oxidase n=1 Tax=Bosea sp. 124 TaxID=2135642 RepID=UPI000D368880|nr:alpha-hydroxy acid oxidase [Bosea sp. 124]PTM39511.1 L-lactate dehydrogenase (cytochrome) [Bosea sp. 124]